MKEIAAQEDEGETEESLGVKQADVKVIFSNVEVIHVFNSTLLKELEERVESSSKLVGDIFLRMVSTTRFRKIGRRNVFCETHFLLVDRHYNRPQD